MSKNLLEEAREQLRQEQEAQRHSEFIRGLEGKTFSELSLKEQSYLYNNHKRLYSRIKEDKSLAVYDIETLDKLNINAKIIMYRVTNISMYNTR